MDACAAAVTSGACAAKFRVRSALKTSALYGAFQGLMPVLGFYLGKSLLKYIATYGHWVAFALLCFIGVKMLVDALKKDDSPDEKTDYSSTKVLLLMAFVTSVDALAVGISLAIEGAQIYLSAAVITTVTFVVCFAGYALGGRLGEKYKRGSLALGGLVLVFLSIKILFEHLIL